MKEKRSGSTSESLFRCAEDRSSARGRRDARWAFVLLALTWWVLPGCPSGNYRGRPLAAAARKVVVYDVQGPSGKEFTRMMGTELCTLGRSVVYGSEIGGVQDVPNVLAAANLARQAGAEAFVMGTITESAQVGYSQYAVRGHFELFDAREASQIGGVDNAECVEDAEPLFTLNCILVGPIELIRIIADPKGKSIYKSYADTSRAKAAVMAPKVNQILANHVAKELDKGLRGQPPPSQAAEAASSKP